MFVLARAATYAPLFIGLLLIVLPSRILSATGIVRPAAIDAPQVAGAILGAAGAALAAACITTFASRRARPSVGRLLASHGESQHHSVAARHLRRHALRVCAAASAIASRTARCAG
jgi:hypothetical protein